MTENDNSIVKNAVEIGALASKLNPEYQAYVLNTVSTLLYSQSVQSPEPNEEKKSAKQKGRTK